MTKSPLFVHEVGPRDGLQNESCFVPTAQKIELIDALSQTGVSKIEVTSFVSPRAIPALADAEAVMRGIKRVPHVCYAALVPNLRGTQRALEAGVDEINVVMSLSETHNLCNLRMTREQSASALDGAIAEATNAGVPSNVALSCAFGCPMEGEVSLQAIHEWVHRFVDMGAKSITLCDTTGMANPAHVANTVSSFLARWPRVPLTLHLHNTRGMGLANVLAAVQAGANRFDAALGGVGGCPYAPGASGNVCTEDMVHMLAEMGFETGVDLEALIACSKRLAKLVGHDLEGQVAKAGPRWRRHPPPDWLPEVRQRALARQ